MKFLWISLGIIGAAAILLIANHDNGSVFGVENNRFASLIYLGIWGTLLAGAVLPRQGSLKEAARNALGWIAIILVLMTGYVYRYELQDFGSRMTGGLNPGSPVSIQSADGHKRIMLIRADSGHFEAQGSVNGTGVGFLVDTGASTVVLTAADAERAGMRIADLRFSSPVSTANGTTTAARATVDTIEIGSIERRRMSVMVAKPGALSQSLLGMNFIDSLWGFEIRGDRLTLTDRIQ